MNHEGKSWNKIFHWMEIKNLSREEDSSIWIENKNEERDEEKRERENQVSRRQVLFSFIYKPAKVGLFTFSLNDAARVVPPSPSEWSLITRVGELVTAELINTRRDTVNPTRITDRDAPHTSNDPWPITRARNLIFKNVHAVVYACTRTRGSGFWKIQGTLLLLIYHFLRFPPLLFSDGSQ